MVLHVAALHALLRGRRLRRPRPSLYLSSTNRCGLKLGHGPRPSVNLSFLLSALTPVLPQVRCLVDVPGEKLPSAVSGALQEYLRSTVAPQVPAQLRDAFLAAVDQGRIRSMQNKLMPAAPLHRPGALLLGDAFNMRHPLTGGGMTVGSWG